MKNFVIRIFLLSTLMLLATSCQKYVADAILPQRPNKEFTMDKDATPEFRQGFEDGCEVGMSAGSNTFYKIFYRSNKIDGYKSTNSGDYKNAWGIGFWWCYRKDHWKTSSSIWGSMMEGLQ